MEFNKDDAVARRIQAYKRALVHAESQ